MTQFARIDKLELSHSSRCAFRACPRKFEFRKLYNNSRRSESLAAGSGTALHNGIQTYLATGDREEAEWHFIRTFPIEFQKSLYDNRSIVGSWVTLQNMMNWERLQEFELARISVNGEEKPATEVPFILRIENFPWYEDGEPITIDYVGYIDLIMYSKLNDTFAVFDIKTTEKNFDESVKYTFDEQCLPYGLVLESLLNHDLSLGFEVDYWVAVTNALEPRNKLYSFQKSPVDIQEWLVNYIEDLGQIRKYYLQGYFPRYGNACMGFNRPCVNADFCSTRDRDTIEMLIASDELQKEGREVEPWVIVDLRYE